MKKLNDIFKPKIQISKFNEAIDLNLKKFIFSSFNIS